MAYNLTNVGRIAIAHQTTWGTPTTLAASFTALECEASLPPVTREVFERNTITSGHYYLTPIEGSQHGQEYSITFPLHGMSSAGSGLPTVTPTIPASGTIAHPEIHILKSLMGGAHAGGYLALSTSTGTDNGIIPIDSSTDSDITDNFATGQAIAVRTTPTGSSDLEYRAAYVQSITNNVGSDDNLVLLQNLGGTVAADETIYGAKTAFIDTSIETLFFTLEWRSLDNTSRIVMDSCVVKSVELTLDPRGVPTCSATFVVNGMELSTGTALGDQAFTLQTIPTAIGKNAARYLSGNTATAINNLSITIEQDLAPKLDHAASNGVGGLLCTARRATASFSELLTAAPLFNLQTGLDPIFLQLGTTPGNMMCVCIPAPIEMAVGNLGDQDGLIMQERTYHPGNNTSAAANASPLPGTGSDPMDSDFRISFL